jgi:hypothetical protein
MGPRQVLAAMRRAARGGSQPRWRNSAKNAEISAAAVPVAGMRPEYDSSP